MVKIALGTSREVVQTDCIQALVVEFICTFLFVFAGVGSVMATEKAGASDIVGLLFVGMTHAFAAAVMIAAGFNISGGHLNPAVTIGLAAGGHITVVRSILYWIDQCAASAAACFLLNYLTGGLSTLPWLTQRRAHFKAKAFYLLGLLLGPIFLLVGFFQGPP